MYYGLVFFPNIEHKGFHEFRKKYEPYAELLHEHITFIFPTPEAIGKEKLVLHITNVLRNWKPFKVHFYSLEKTKDHWLYLAATEGNSEIIKLHDDLYTGILLPYLRKDLPFYSHIVLGLFSKEKYDFNDPTAELTLDNSKYNQARKEFEDLGYNLWCTIDQLTLIQINSEFTKTTKLRNFELS